MIIVNYNINYFKMRVKIILLVLIAGCVFNGFSQNAPDIEWEKNFGGTLWDEPECIEQTSDGGHIAAGITYSIDLDVTGNHGLIDVWVVKLDATGNLLWQSALGGSEYEGAHSIKETSDGGFILVGYSTSIDGQVTNNHGANDIWLVKLDGQGNLLWQRSLGGSYEDIGMSIVELSSTDIVVAAMSSSLDGDVTGNHGFADFWIIKLDATGNIIWENSFGGSLTDRPYCIIEVNNGDLVITGSTKSNDGDVSGNHGDHDVWLIKIDDSGNLIWQKTFGGSDQDVGISIDGTADGGCVIAGHTSSNDGDVTGNYGYSDIWVIKLDTIGNMEWQKNYGGSITDIAKSIQQTDDGGYIVAGGTNSSDGDVTNLQGIWDYWILKLDSIGDLIWQKTFGGSQGDIGSSVIETVDNGFVVAGYSYSSDGDVLSNNGQTDFWIIKLSFTVGIEEQYVGELSIMQNPAFESTQISIELLPDLRLNGPIELSLISTDGRLVHSEQLKAQYSFTHTIQLSGLSPGLYFVHLRDRNRWLGSEKLVVE